MHMRHAIRARQQLRQIARRRHCIGPCIRAEVGPGPAAQAENAAVAAAGDFEFALNFARVGGCHQVFAPVFDPFHRTVEPPCGKRNQKIFREEFAARAETAADVGFNRIDGVFGQAEHFCQRRAHEKRHFGRTGECHAPARRIPFSDEAARFHRHCGVAVHLEGFAARVLRLFESPFDVAAHGAQRCRLITAAFFKQQHGTSIEAAAIGHRGQGINLDSHEVRGVFRDRRANSDNQRHRLADITYFVARHHRLHHAVERWLRFGAHGDGRHVVAKIHGGNHRAHAGQRQRGGRVEAADAAVRNRTAHHRGMQQAVAVQVINILAAPSKEAQVFDTLDGSPDIGIPARHGVPPRFGAL